MKPLDYAVIILAVALVCLWFIVRPRPLPFDLPTGPFVYVAHHPDSRVSSAKNCLGTTASLDRAMVIGADRLPEGEFKVILQPGSYVSVGR